MHINEIAKELTLKAMDNNWIRATETGSATKLNKSFADETSKFYKTVLQTVKETQE